jgi:hypothetical protein
MFQTSVCEPCQPSKNRVAKSSSAEVTKVGKETAKPKAKVTNLPASKVIKTVKKKVQVGDEGGEGTVKPAAKSLKGEKMETDGLSKVCSFVRSGLLQNLFFISSCAWSMRRVRK